MEKNTNRLIWEKIVQEVVERNQEKKATKIHRNSLFDVRNLLHKIQKSIPHP